jgi:hypothetical protein
LDIWAVVFGAFGKASYQWAGGVTVH